MEGETRQVAPGCSTGLRLAFPRATCHSGAKTGDCMRGRGSIGKMAMTGEQPRGSGFWPLVPPPRGSGPEELLAMQRRGIEMVAAANRLAMTWLQAAAQQHAQVTRRTLDEMTENARRLAGVSAPPEAAQVMVAMLDRAQSLGLETAQEIGALMQRMQGDTVQLMGQVMRGGKAED
jgi:hypothetical protein